MRQREADAELPGKVSSVLNRAIWVQEVGAAGGSAIGAFVHRAQVELEYRERGALWVQVTDEVDSAAGLHGQSSSWDTHRCYGLAKTTRGESDPE